MSKEPTTSGQLKSMRARAETMADEAPVRRKPGRPPKVRAEPIDEMEAGFEPAARRAPTRQAARDSSRDTLRVTTRRGAMVVTGRNGEQLTRRRTQVGDPYHVPQSEIPDGWSYQWNPVTVLNEEQTRMQNMHYANGWRPVPADRHPGRWMKPGVTGDIIVEGLRLEERPEELTKEALTEETAKARQQVRDQTDSLRLSKKLPEGFQAGQRYRGTGADVRLTVDRSLELPPGEYQPADDDA
jgi:hypothetical protein